MDLESSYEKKQLQYKLSKISLNKKLRTYLDFNNTDELDENLVSCSNEDPFEICGLNLQDFLLYYYHQYFEKESTALERWSL